MSDRQFTYRHAINDALRQEMRRDPTVIVMGEDMAGAPGRDDPEMLDAWGGVNRSVARKINRKINGDIVIGPSAPAG